MKTENEIAKYLQKFGKSAENIKQFFETNLQTLSFKSKGKKHTPINDTFTYGITGNCVHLHFPKSSFELIKQSNI